MKIHMKMAIMVLLSISSAATASDWKVVGSADDLLVEVDQQSISKISPGIRKAWTKYTFTKPQVVSAGFPTTYSIGLLLQHVNCETNSSSTAQKVLYADLSQQEQISSAKYKTQDFVEAVPDSVGESAIKFICAPGQNRR